MTDKRGKLIDSSTKGPGSTRGSTTSCTLSTQASSRRTLSSKGRSMSPLSRCTISQTLSNQRESLTRLSAANHREGIFTNNELMQFRWLKQLQQSFIPDIDLEDINAVLDDPREGRQFAPEYSQHAYKQMLAKDYILGDYIKDIDQDIIQFNSKDRELLIAFVSDLHKKKEYRLETLHLACHLVDRYLAFLVRNKMYK